MDLMSIAAAIYAQLAANLIEKSGKALSQKFKTPEKERAVDRCVHGALVALLTSAVDLEEHLKKRLKKILENFFADDHTVQELKALLRGIPANREELWAIFQDHAGEEGSVPGFDFERAIDLFEAAFIEAAVEEPELVEIIQVRELREQSGLQKEMLTAMGEMVRYLESIDRETLKLGQGILTAQSTANQQTIRFEIPAITVSVQLEAPKTPIPIVDVTLEQREKRQRDQAKTRYLESLTRECLSLPLSAVSDEATQDTAVTLEDVYIHLDTTTPIVIDEKGNRIEKPDALKQMDEKKTRPLKVIEAASEHKNLVLLGEPGAGKSTFVRMLCARLALGDYPPEFESGILPVFIQLRDLAPKVAALNLKGLSGDQQNSELAATLHQQIRAELRRLEAGEFTDTLCKEVRSGNCLLVLDGLDEVPFDQRGLIRQTVAAIIGKYTPQRIIVTCRIRSYMSDNEGKDQEKHKLPGFQEFTIAKLDAKKIKTFVAAWYNSLKDVKLTLEKRKEKIDQLEKAAFSEELKEISPNPMLLTTMAIIHQRDIGLPDKRVELYKMAVEVLVRRWRKHKTDTLAPSDALSEFLKDNKRLDPALELLAYTAHSTDRKKGEAGDLSRLRARELLEGENYLNNIGLAKEFLDYMDQKSGLLIGRGGDLDKPVSYAFAHRTFQEYLAGCYLVSHLDMYGEILKLAEEGDYWSNAVQLGFEELLYNRKNERNLLTLAYLACGAAKAKDVVEERRHLWSANIAVLLGVNKIKQDTYIPNGGSVYLQRLRRSLVHLLSGRLPFPERVEAGRNLAALGDLESLNIKPLYSLRTSGIDLSYDAAKAMLKKLDFFDSDWSKEGKGCIHVYQPQTLSGDKVVLDYATGLMWQQAGTPKAIKYDEAKEYIDKLNRDRFAGFNDWRLPTLEEAMSLMEREKRGAGLYIDPVFDQKQRWIWCADKSSASVAWVVSFYYGICHDLDVETSNYCVRAVRSGQSS